jgi:hypothetical protein
LIRCHDCKQLFEPGRRGPKPRRCQACTKAHKSRQDSRRPRGRAKAANTPATVPEPSSSVPPCCADSAGSVCDQHKQARQSRYQAERYEQETRVASSVDEMFNVFGQGYRIERLPDQPEIDTDDPALAGLADDPKLARKYREWMERVAAEDEMLAYR